jgi:hypothetical protein
MGRAYIGKGKWVGMTFWSKKRKKTDGKWVGRAYIGKEKWMGMTFGKRSG